jgi:hypothetical protein
MTQHIVTGAAVVLATDDGSERYLYRGAYVTDGFTPAAIAHAVGLGLLTEVEEIEDVTTRLELERQVAEAEADIEYEARVQEAAKSLVAATAPELEQRLQQEVERVSAEREEQFDARVKAEAERLAGLNPPAPDTAKSTTETAPAAAPKASQQKPAGK